MKARVKLATECTHNMIQWLSRRGSAGIHDATNSTKRRRVLIKKCLKAVGVRSLSLKSLCTDPTIDGNKYPRDQAKVPALLKAGSR